ncbi:MAG: hypothetical protein HKP61_22635 [Dactylosporangium sp.]|nr:hypothetical protein [Dactylosporangium sp.]NNJ63675.1 hypothetical protein [Dactylosporangium sp.]
MTYRARFAGLALALVTAGALTVACGSSADDEATASGDDFATCMREHGVDIGQMNPSARPSGARPSGQFSGGPPNGQLPDGSARPRPSGSGRSDASGRPGGPGGGFGDQMPPGVDEATWNEALEACASLRPSGDARGQGNRDDSATAAYLNCLSEHGVTATSVADLESTDPTVAAAMQACLALQPSGAAPSPAAT